MTINPITLCGVGLVIVVAGTALFIRALARKDKEPNWVPLVFAGVSGSLGGALVLVGAESWLVLSALSLAGASIVMTFLRCGVTEWLAKLLARPMVQSALLLMAGVTMIGLGLYRIEYEQEKSLDETEQMLQAGATTSDLFPATGVACRTDKGRSIEVHVLRSSAAEGAPGTAARYLRRQRLETHLIQTGPGDGEYNCHGWIFAAGRFWLRGRMIELILEDNGYREVQVPRIGDVAIFRDAANEVSHSALVRGRGSNGMILLESKWGQLGRYIHTAQDHVYRGHSIRYFRTERGSHTIAGLDSVKPDLVPVTEDE